MDLVAEVDERYGAGKLQSDSPKVQKAISQFRSTFPSRARPSSRAAFLFQGNGDPLWKSTFEETLAGTDELLSQMDGPFFCGNELTAAEVAWAPFLERYRYQLPCLHEGLEPYHEVKYPHLFRWYQAMDKVPEYACRVKGDASSWRKVLSMAGFGNGGLPPHIGSNMDDLARREIINAASAIDQSVWEQYSATRAYVASTPQAEAGAIIVKNRAALLKDTLKRASSWGDDLSTTEEGIDEALRGLSQMLMEGKVDANPPVRALASFIDERMCIPRDMGAMSAASIKKIANA
jgi:glutathione S-transferase